MVSISSLVKSHVTDAVMRSAELARRRPSVSVRDEIAGGVGTPFGEELKMENAYPPSAKSLRRKWKHAKEAATGVVTKKKAVSGCAKTR